MESSQLIDWELVIDLASLLALLEQKNLIDASSKEHAKLLESLYINIQHCQDFDQLWALAYDAAGWSEPPNKEVVKISKNFGFFEF